MVVTFKDFKAAEYNVCCKLYGDEVEIKDFTTVYEGEVIQTFVINNHVVLLVMDSITKKLVEVEADRCTVVER